eukprot:CAMPEP_0119345828 /NCGR_PEP_ID=MMETSP1333-20130426/107690_1 /TAXON_ID=418940 /ORGANISM="Scyphosphaera apsteinii, Strain RCC1455" /LENGTH=33 /DNA_ID= /DNA_START= /DNA_END= /DNA_ORIENTATION=
MPDAAQSVSNIFDMFKDENMRADSAPGCGAFFI